MIVLKFSEDIQWYPKIFQDVIDYENFLIRNCIYENKSIYQALDRIISIASISNFRVNLSSFRSKLNLKEIAVIIF